MIGPAAAAPIGVFDSGLGGLTVVRALARHLPRERLIYFGDTARVPYGPKSPETIRRYSREIAGYLTDQGVKAIVVACNTATAHALPTLRAALAMPVIGVIEPGARAAIAASRGGAIGVIGTSGTIGSRAYADALHALEPGTRVIARACPLFVPLVEEGWLDTDVTRSIAQRYLGTLRDAGVDTLVLGCTHYPLLETVIAEVMGPGVRLIDSADAAAVATRVAHDAAGLAAVEDRSGAGLPHHRFIASDDADQFLRAGSRFLGTPIDRVETVTLG